MWNDGKKKSQLLCKVCQSLFSTASEGRFSKIYVLRCPHCNNALVHKKDRKHFIVHKCVNPKCSYYLNNLKKVSKKDIEEDYGKNKYKLHYIYREFNINFFKIDIKSLPKNASSLKFSKFDKNVMGLCLTYKINLGLSLRKTAQALNDIHGISISHQHPISKLLTTAKQLLSASSLLPTTMITDREKYSLQMKHISK